MHLLVFIITWPTKLVKLIKSQSGVMWWWKPIKCVKNESNQIQGKFCKWVHSVCKKLQIVKGTTCRNKLACKSV